MQLSETRQEARKTKIDLNMAFEFDGLDEQIVQSKKQKEVSSYKRLPPCRCNKISDRNSLLYNQFNHQRSAVTVGNTVGCINTKRKFYGTLSIARKLSKYSIGR